MEYLEKARVIYEELKTEQGLSLVYGNLAAVYLDQEDYDQALLFTEKNIGGAGKMGDKHGTATTFSTVPPSTAIKGDCGRHWRTSTGHRDFP
ncbi:MAG: tetratricopeptide repeat protein [Saprospiraceae bacterium]|nr:tetratricopeptide repeat protein [Saprospiraceae bacterium]